MQKEEFQHTAYSTNAYVTIGPLAKQVLHGKNYFFSSKDVCTENLCLIFQCPSLYFRILTQMLVFMLTPVLSKLLSSESFCFEEFNIENNNIFIASLVPLSGQRC